MSTTVEYDILVEVLDAVKDLKKLQQQTKKTKDKFDEGRKSGTEFAGQVGAAFTGLAAAGGIVVGAVQKVAGAFIAAAEAGFALSRSVVDNINDLNDLSARSSISAQSIEALKLAFESSGQSADNAKTIISQFPRVLTQIQKDGTQANQVLRTLGVDPKRLKDGNQAFLESVKAIESIEDQTLKAQAATAIFGRSAGDLLQALGAGEFDQFTASIERYGTKAGPEASVQAAQFQKRLAAISVIVDRATQAFVQNTGILDVFIRGLEFTQQALAGLNAFLKAGQVGLRGLASDIISFAIAGITFLADKITSFVAGPLFGLLKGFDLIQQQVTGKSLFSKAIEEIAVFTASQYDLTEAIDQGRAAFQQEGEAIQLDKAAKLQNSEATEQSSDILKQLASVLAETTKKTEKNTDETDKNTEAKRRAAAVEKARNQMLKIRQGVLDDLAKANERRNKAISDVQSIISDSNDDQITSFERINRELEKRLVTLELIGRQEGINTDAARRAATERAIREQSALRQQQIAGGITAGMRAVSSPQGLLDVAGAAAGPIGSAVASALGGLAALGDVSAIDEERLKRVMDSTGKDRDAALKQILIDDKAAEFEVFFEAIVRGLQILPGILSKTLPPILIKAVATIGAEINRLPFVLLGIIIEGIGTGIQNLIAFFQDEFTLEKLGESIVNGLKDVFNFFFGPIADALRTVFGGDSKMGGGRMLSAQSGLRFTGQSQGLAMLHAGEMVVPRSGQMSSSVARDVEAHTSAGGITININSAITERSAIDELVRKIERRFGGFGQSTSPLFGGL